MIGAGFALFGLVFFVIGAGIARAAARFRRHAERAEGRILSLRMRSSSSSRAMGMSSGGDPAISPPSVSGGGSSWVYLPTVAFTTRDGREVSAEAAVGSNPPPGRAGATVGVLYDPNHPERFRVDTLLGRGGCLPIVFIVIGLVFVAIGALVLSIAAG